MAEDGVALLMSLALLAALLALAELAHRRFGWSSLLTRRLVHAATGLYVVFFPLLFEHAVSVYLLASIFVVVNGLALARGWLRGVHPADRVTAGTVAFPLALLAILPFTWEPQRFFILRTSFLVLALADPLAAAVGERAGRSQVRVGRGTKNVAGSATFFLTAWLLTLLGIGVFGPSAALDADSPGRWTLVALLVAAIATGAEALGGRGWDNLFIVLAVAAVLLILQLQPEWLAVMALGCAIGVGFGVFAWRVEYLTLSGAIAGGLFAATLIGIGRWGWAVPGFTFFFLSSALSKLAPQAKGSYAEASLRESRRDAGQVYANGGVAWLLVVAYALVPDSGIYWAFVGSLAAAAADTWATEVGPLFRQDARMILTGRRVPAGTSGAVTAVGTAAGVAGAAVVWLAAWWTAPDPLRTTGPVVTAAAVVVGGVFGSLVDSLLGATVEGVYRDPDSGGLADARGLRETGAEPARGWRVVDNEVVNAACTLVGAAVAAGVLGLLT